MKKYFVQVNNNEYEVIIREEGEERVETKTSAPDKTDRQPEQKVVSSQKTKTEKAPNLNPVNEELTAVPAPMSGKVLGVRSQAGDRVEKGQVIITIEAMKMETEITAPVSGTINTILVSEGHNCKRGEKLALIDEAGGA